MVEVNAGSSTRKLEVLNTDDETCVTFYMNGEDHTLGNSLRYLILKNPEVKFCSYAVPHPSENKINLKIQTAGMPAVKVLEEGLNSLYETCGHILDTFKFAVKKYENVTSMETE